MPGKECLGPVVPALCSGIIATGACYHASLERDARQHDWRELFRPGCLGQCRNCGIEFAGDPLQIGDPQCHADMWVDLRCLTVEAGSSVMVAGVECQIAAHCRSFRQGWLFRWNAGPRKNVEFARCPCQIVLRQGQFRS